MSTDDKGRHSSLDARDDLLWVADRWHFLTAKLRPGGGSAEGVRVSSCPEPALPIDVAVSDLMREVEDNARFYARVLMDDCAWLPTTSAMPALLNEVAQRHGHFTEDPRVALEFSDNASDLREKVRKCLDRPEAPTYLGPCQTSECVGELYVSAGKDSGRCRICGEAFTVSEQREWLDVQLDARLMTQAEIVRALKVLGTPVEFPTIRQWVKRGRLTETEDGLYRLADAQALAHPRAHAA